MEGAVEASRVTHGWYIDFPMRQLLEGAMHGDDIGARSHSRGDEVARQHRRVTASPGMRFGREHHWLACCRIFQGGHASEAGSA